MIVNAATVKSFLSSTTARLTGSYLAIIMLMSIGFSIVFYNASAHELGRQVPPPGVFTTQAGPGVGAETKFIGNFFENRISEGRHHLLVRLIVLNFLALVGGSALSYYLARRTLEPIETNMEAQSQFVSDASHELRTPLTALQTTNEVALRKNKVSSKEAKDVFRHNITEVTKLEALTNNLLRLAKQDKSDLVFEAVALPKVVSDALNTVMSGAVEKKITIDDKIPKLKVLADKSSLTQALVTILDNAVKYSPQKSTITVTARTHGNHALLSVQDKGKGISPGQLPRIFDRFYRADESRNKDHQNGYGLGLALAKKIIDQHDGEIIVQSTAGKGSTFTLKLPLS